MRRGREVKGTFKISAPNQALQQTGGNEGDTLLFAHSITNQKTNI